MIPSISTIEEALKNDDLKSVYKSEERARKLLDTAKVVEGLARNSSIHAAGVIISKDPLSTHVPLQKMNGDEVVAQYEMNSVSDIGLLKMGLPRPQKPHGYQQLSQDDPGCQGDQPGYEQSPSRRSGSL